MRKDSGQISSIALCRPGGPSEVILAGTLRPWLTIFLYLVCLSKGLGSYLPLSGRWFWWQ